MGPFQHERGSSRDSIAIPYAACILSGLFVSRPYPVRIMLRVRKSYSVTLDRAPIGVNVLERVVRSIGVAVKAAASIGVSHHRIRITWIHALRNCTSAA